MTFCLSCGSSTNRYDKTFLAHGFVNNGTTAPIFLYEMRDVALDTWEAKGHKSIFANCAGEPKNVFSSYLFVKITIVV